MPRSTWAPTSGEDRLLHQFWTARGSTDTLYTEVGVAGRRKASPWREGSTERRIDGVCLATPSQPGIFPKKGTKGLFKGMDGSVDLIEVKRGLSEAVIGQCLNLHWFESLLDARRRTAAWRRHYKHARPHGALGNLNPKKFYEAWVQAN